MIGLDEERIFQDARKWKIGALFGIIFFFLLSASVMFVLMVVTSIPLADTEIGIYNVIALLGIATAIFSVLMLLLYRYYRHLYFYPHFEQSSTGAYKDPTPARCGICGRHPVSKTYHIRRIHLIKRGDIQQYYENCRCKYCTKPIHISGIGV